METRFIVITVTVVVLVACISTACWFFPVEQILNDFILWVEKDGGPWGPLVYVLGYILCSVLAIPVSLLTVGGGYLFGFVFGFIAASIGAVAGCTAAFMVGRIMGRSYVASKLKDYPQFQSISLAVERSGFKIVVLLRMVPVIPFNMINYGLAIMPISCGTFTLGSWLGSTPTILIFVYAGTTIKNIRDFSRGDVEFTPFRWILLASGLLASVIVGVLLSRIAKDALERAVKEGDSEADEIVVAPAAIDAVNAEGPEAQLQQPLVVRIESCGREIP